MNFKTTIQKELDSFFKQVEGHDFSIRQITKGAFSQARAKLEPWAFKRLNKVAVDTFYEKVDFHKWLGHRVLAIDGTWLRLPKHKSIEQIYGSKNFGAKASAPVTMAVCSMLYDVLNQISIDAELGTFTTSEKDLLLKQIDHVKPGDVLLLDRGYPCFWLLFLLKAKGIDFCVRLKDEWWTEVIRLLAQKQDERIVKFKLPAKDKHRLEQYPEFQNKEIECRLIKVKLPDGEIEILCTSLLEQQKYKMDEFKQLYHFRWNEEEAYKLLKSRVELEDWSGKTAIAVEQDLQAKIFLMTLMASYAHPIEEKVRAEYQQGDGRKFGQKINRTFALAKTVEILIPIFIRKKIREALIFFDEIIYRTREIIRPGRSVPRKKKPKKLYHMNYKRF